MSAMLPPNPDMMTAPSASGAMIPAGGGAQPNQGQQGMPGTQSDPTSQLMAQTMNLTMQMKSINDSFPGGEDEMTQAIQLILQSMKKKAQGLNVPAGGPSPSIPY